MRPSSSSATRARSSSGVSVRSSQSAEVGVAHHRASSATSRPASSKKLAPLGDAVVADVARVAEPVGLLGALARERVVLDHDAVARDAGHLLDRGERVGEVVRGDAAGDGVEARVGEREMVGGRDHVGLHARRGVDGDDLRSRLAQPPRDVAAAGRDVEHRHARRRLAPRDDEVEIVAGRMRRARAVRLRALAPDVASLRRAPPRAARRRASSPRDGCSARPASARICRPSSAFVPSSRTTIGYSICRAARAPRGSRARPRRSA